MKFKKAQIQMGETIFVIIIILILIAFGLVFLFNAGEDSSEKQLSEFEELDSVALSQLVANLPEIIHAPSSVKQQSSFDTSKLEAFQTIINDNPEISMEYYFEKLGNVEIYIEQIYPESLNNWTLYINNFDIEVDNPISFGKPMKIPTSLYDPVRDEFAFGMLYVTKYVRAR